MSKTRRRQLRDAASLHTPRVVFARRATLIAGLLAMMLYIAHAWATERSSAQRRVPSSAVGALPTQSSSR
ncbi:hypothetical protein KBD13_03515 [Patescibacteria group bacterium]|nr:hypothetical protein [Patescibacteria group bacterium]